MTNIINKVIKNGTEYQIYASGGAAITVDSELSTTSTNPAQNKVITTAINSKAEDNAVVKLTGNQTVAGTKTFSTSPVVPSKNSAASSSNKTVIATEAQVALKQDALTLPSSPTSGHIVTWGANNKTLADGGSIPTVNNSTITFTQGGVSKGTITTNQSSASTIALDAGGNYDNITKSEIQYGTATTQRTISASVIKESLPTISGESNNILGYAKIRAGNKSDYDAMNSHDANTLYFCIDDGWKPGANTLAWYKLNGNANDSSGNGNNGTPTNISYVTDNGIQVANFTGGYITIPSLGVLSTSLTVNLRMKSSQASGTEYIMVYLAPSGDNKNLSVGVYNTYAKSYGWNGSTSVELNSSTVVNNGVWHNIVVSVDGSNWKIYVDGTLKNTISCSHPIESGIYSGFGDNIKNKNRTYNGYLSEIILENKVWTATEISDYYNATKSKYGL